MSTTSSVTPLIVENSCSTPAILIAEIANPSKDESNTLLSEFPTVCPKPGSRGLNSNVPSKSSAFEERFCLAFEN